MPVTTENLNETYALAADFITQIEPNEAKATIVGLYGDLGAGKTSFAQGVAKALGVEEVISSPTFIIEKIYKVPAKSNQPSVVSFNRLIHIDAYRLDSADELEALGFNEIIKDPQNLILIEWPEKVAELLPADHTKINFKFIDENTREINFQT